jgi:protein-disulfide isomerase
MTTLTIPVGPDDHVEGNRAAVCTLLEYGDYECPHCGAAYPIVKRIQKHFGKQLSFVYRNFPLIQAHPNAEAAAETAEFAATHGKFWEMHDLLYENQQDLAVENLHKLAKSLKLAPKDLDKALENQEFQPRVRADFVSGVRSGVNGTPTFFINGTRADVQADYDSLITAIEDAISITGK